MRMTRRDALWFVLILLSATLLSSCLHAIQETTCKTKFKKKYDCPFSDIEIVENEVVLGNIIKLRGCGRTVTYDGTTEVRQVD